MVNTIVTLVAFALIYYLGKRVGFRRGHREAETHCQQGFIAKLSFYKQMFDEALRHSMVYPETDIELAINGEIIIQGTVQDVANKALELDKLIKTIDNIVPA